MGNTNDLHLIELPIKSRMRMRLNLVSPMMVVCKDFCHICYAFVFGRDMGTRSMGESQGGYAQDKKSKPKGGLN